MMSVSVGRWATAALSATLALTKAQAPLPPSDYDWDAIEPTEDLRYHDCYEDYRCARLLVPLDWSQTNTTADADYTASIAIIAAPAVVPESDPTFGGTIIYNAGGPFVSGIGALPIYRDALRSEFDIPGKKHYELLSFDTRGVMFSTPKADCFQGDEFSRYASRAETRAWPNPAHEPYALRYYHNNALAYGELCAEASKNQGEGSVFPHMSTAVNARDMLEIVNRIAELRGSEAGNGTAQADDKKPRLQYYGVSGGSMLGNVFASMFPDRVGRLLVDAVPNMDYWFEGTYLSVALSDSEKIYEGIYETCFEMGDDCLIWDPSDSGPDDIRKRVESTWKEFQQNPPQVVYNGRIHQFPMDEFSFNDLGPSVYSTDDPNNPLGARVVAMQEGDWNEIFPDFNYHPFEMENSTGTCPQVSIEPGWPTGYTWWENVFHGTTCADAFYGPNLWADIDEARKLFEDLDDTVPLMGRSYAHWAIKCIGWSIEPKFWFGGPLGSPAPDQKLRDEGVAAPLLIANTRLDASTPLAGAYRMSRAHEDSAVVVVEAARHGAVMYSQCLKEIVQEYFDKGTMPKNDTSCEEGGYPEADGEASELRSQLMARNLF